MPIYIYIYIYIYIFFYVFPSMSFTALTPSGDESEFRAGLKVRCRALPKATRLIDPKKACPGVYGCALNAWLHTGITLTLQTILDSEPQQVMKQQGNMTMSWKL